MSGKRPVKKKRRSKAQRRRRQLANTPAQVVGIGDHVHRGKGKKRQEGTIIGWDLRDPKKVVWYVTPRRRPTPVKRDARKARGKSATAVFVDEVLGVELQPWQEAILDEAIGTKVEAAIGPVPGVVIIPACPVCHGGMEVNTPRPGIYGEHLPYYCSTCQQYRGAS